MAINTGVNLLNEGAHSLAGATSRTSSGSITTVSGRCYIFSVSVRGGSGGLTAAGTASFSGTGLTLTTAEWLKNAGASFSATVFLGVATENSSGTVTWTRAGADTVDEITLCVDELQGADSSGTEVQSADADNATSGALAVTLSSFGAGNGAWSYAGSSLDSAPSPDTDWTELVDFTNSGSLQHETAWRATEDTSVSITWAGTQFHNQIAIELKAAAAAGAAGAAAFYSYQMNR